MTQTKTQQHTPQIFTIWSNEIEGRIDPSFYRLEFKELNKILAGLRTVKFSELINSISMGASIPKYKEEKNEVPFIFGKNVKHGFLDLSNLEYISKKTSEKFKSSILKENDLVFSVRGVYIGKVAKIPKELKGGNIINNLVRINLKDEKLADYLTIYLSSKIGQALINREVWGGAQSGITNEQIKNLQIPLPSLQIQNKIVSIMSKAYEEKKKKETEAEKLLDSIDNYVLKELGISTFAKATVDKKKEMVFEIWSDEVVDNRIDAEYWQPKFLYLEKSFNDGKYRINKLGDYIDKIINGLDYRKFSDEGRIYLRVSSIRSDKINFKDVKKVNLKNISKDIKLNKDDLLLTRKGTFGIAQTIKKDNDFLISSEIFKINLTDSLNSEYAKIILNSIIGQMQFEKNKIGAIMGSLSQGAVKEVKVPVPPLAIQNKIVEKVNLIYKKSQILQKEAKENLEKAKTKVEKMILG